MAGSISMNVQKAYAAVEVEDIVRVFTARRKAPVRALDGVSLSIGRGEVHGLLGPNGAGKTTLVKILSTVLLPTSGRARVCGHDVVAEARKVRALVGIVFGGERGLYGRLTARQNLEYWGALYRVPRADLRARADALLDRVGLSDRAESRVETFSRGMKQRLHLARGLVGGASVLFLDEPTMGMDPIAARDFRGLIEKLQAQGHTILLTTHDMAEAEALCDRVTLIDHGKVIATESPRSLAHVISRLVRVDVENANAVVLDQVARLAGVKSIDRNEAQTRIHVDGEDALPAILRFLVDHGITWVKTSPPSLEEVYVGLIDGRAGEA